MHFQRTAGLEQEIENLKKQLATCTRENLNLQEELSEASRIKSQLADLHAAEVTKNMEAEKQVKFFQGCVAAAFAERDHSIMEAEKAKEKEDLMSQKFNAFQKRLEELTSENIEQRKLSATLQVDLAKQEELNETFKEVISKFYEIRLQSLDKLEDTSWDDKCAYLLLDPAEMWSFNDTSTSQYISALEDELEKLRSSVENLQSKLRMGLEIENHLKKSVCELEQKIIRLDKFIIIGIAELRHFHNQLRLHIVNSLDEERSHIKSIIDMIKEKTQQYDVIGRPGLGIYQSDEKLDEFECQDLHISNEANTSLVSQSICPGLSSIEANREGDTSKALAEQKSYGPGLSDTEANRKGDSYEALALALQEKVAALLLLSQQEERHLLERNVNAVLQKKIEEIQRNFLQVTNEKVKALVELAQLKQDYHLLQEKISNEVKQGKVLTENGEKRIVTPDREGRFRNLMKKTNLRRWTGALDFSGNETQVHLNNEGDVTSRRSNSMDFARMRIENAALKECMESMDHLTSSIHRLRLSLCKAKESVTSEATIASISESLDEIITEAKLVKTALGSSLPISSSAESDAGSNSGSTDNEPIDIYGYSGNEKIDSVSAAGFEMVELLILAAQILKDRTTQKVS